MPLCAVYSSAQLLLLAEIDDDDDLDPYILRSRFLSFETEFDFVCATTLSVDCTMIPGPILCGFGYGVIPPIVSFNGSCTPLLSSPINRRCNITSKVEFVRDAQPTERSGRMANCKEAPSPRFFNFFLFFFPDDAAVVASASLVTMR